MKDETSGVVIEEFVGLKLKMYLFLVDNSSEHKNARSVKKFVVIINHNEYKDVLLNICLRHLMSRIQSKYYRIETYYFYLYETNNYFFFLL